MAYRSHMMLFLICTSSGATAVVSNRPDSTRKAAHCHMAVAERTHCHPFNSFRIVAVTPWDDSLLAGGSEGLMPRADLPFRE
jgi:hypothetical protein